LACRTFEFRSPLQACHVPVRFPNSPEDIKKEIKLYLRLNPLFSKKSRYLRGLFSNDLLQKLLKAVTGQVISWRYSYNPETTLLTLVPMERPLHDPTSPFLTDTMESFLSSGFLNDNEYDLIRAHPASCRLSRAYVYTPQKGQKEEGYLDEVL
jgi:hypothetical protein